MPPPHPIRHTNALPLRALLLFAGLLLAAAAHPSTAAADAYLGVLKDDPCAPRETDEAALMHDRNTPLRALVCSPKVDFSALGYSRVTATCPQGVDARTGERYSWRGRSTQTPTPWSSAEWAWWRDPSWGRWISWDATIQFWPARADSGLTVSLHNWWPGRGEKLARGFLVCYEQRPVDALSTIRLAADRAWDITDFTALEPPAFNPPARARISSAGQGGSAGRTRIGDARNNRLRGGPGDDTLLGHGGNDVLRGGAGDDALFDNRGRDRIFAGSGNDAVNVRDGNRDTVRCGPGFDVVVADRRDRIARDCERVYRNPKEAPARPPLP